MAKKFLSVGDMQTEHRHSPTGGHFGKECCDTELSKAHLFLSLCFLWVFQRGLANLPCKFMEMLFLFWVNCDKHVTGLACILLDMCLIHLFCVSA